MNIAELYELYQKHPIVSTDSRIIIEDSIFFALKGENFDGNQFAADSLQKGAAYAVIDNPEFATDPRIILVDDVLRCLQQLANYHRKTLNTPVLAITGSNGKTTSKELIAAVLKNRFNITFTQGNLNNHIGVPLTLLKMTEETQIAVIEMGANHPGEIAALCKIAEPNLGLVTNMGKAHLEGFGSFEGVIKTKTELYDFLRENNGKCFVNADNELLMKQSAGLEQLTYGKGEGVQLKGEPEDSSYLLTVKILFPKGWLYFRSQLVGSYNFENIMAAARIGLHFDIDPLLIQKAVEKYTPTNNRSQYIQQGTNRIILDAYNANPTSMLAALQNFEKINHESKIVILGDMLELGDYAQEEHQKIADFVTAQDYNEIFLVGPCFCQVETGTKAKKFEKIELLANYLFQQKQMKNNLILIKGSRGIRMEKILNNF
ncbi:UDP-N-acetylmuramoyl-tripeptide--D-alanyl-D-alanine ligase [Mangrovibacterium diazotrophicum]|uniref:UDP-N-acetylmuramoyl-tripeptide--D-alanyl-D-alanine ligase n=1 Tax=Mangrovibacterium diazotrophicum TaxID=1261403 RepID=A0A419VX05_9BACT|nr:UDP-N-acetylmuramoyl-tripeptide--D-alanyl-D-alanine ligase [Mangrovibacterium diazotrophicum]RKD87748.1 UDP-N-acetylmuramoyl-tripeptide--D-alanyl-D-alanine ligase [Mangrovibacterium diazotrophicum]